MQWPWMARNTLKEQHMFTSLPLVVSRHHRERVVQLNVVYISQSQVLQARFQVLPQQRGAVERVPELEEKRAHDKTRQNLDLELSVCNKFSVFRSKQILESDPGFIACCLFVQEKGEEIITDLNEVARHCVATFDSLQSWVPGLRDRTPLRT